MPKSSVKLEVQFDKNWEVENLRGDDEFAKSATEFNSVVNNGSDFSKMFYEQDESECREVFHENSHAGYKRDSEHR